MVQISFEQLHRPCLIFTRQWFKDANIRFRFHPCLVRQLDTETQPISTLRMVGYQERLPLPNHELLL